MPTLTIELPRPHAGQQRIKDQRARFNVVACGRRFGKTQLGIDLCAEPDVLPHPVGWFSPTYKDMLEVWREVRQVFAPIIRRSSIQERRMEFVTGGVLEFWSLDNVDAGRGRKYRRVIVDEAGMVPYLLEAWQMAIRPTLADLGGDAYFFGTPKGRNGFWRLFQLGQDDERPEWAAFQMPTSGNPFIPAGEVDAMRESLPERVYRQEVQAHFLEDGGGVFRRVSDAVRDGITPGPVAGHEYVFGVDWAQSADFTVVVVLDTHTRQVVEVDRFNQVDYATQRGRVKALAERYRPVLIYAELNSIGTPIVEQLQREGLPVQGFTTTNATKAAAVDALALAFERGDIGIPDHPVLVAELQAFEASKTATGLRRFAAPEGMHDDTVIALALAWQGVAQQVQVLW